jgi:hypothetical protein
VCPSGLRSLLNQLFMVDVCFWEASVECSLDEHPKLGNNAASSAIGKLITKRRFHIITQFFESNRITVTTSTHHNTSFQDVRQISHKERAHYFEVVDSASLDPLQYTSASNSRHSPLAFDTSQVTKKILRSVYVNAALVSRCSSSINAEFAGIWRHSTLTSYAKLVKCFADRKIQILPAQ